MIDRHGLVTRHNPLYTKWEKNAPLSVGNGTFCFTADFTGLQTFFDEYAAADDSFPLCTLAEWGWHFYPGSPRDDSPLRLTPFDAFGRQVSYAVDKTGQEELFKALRQNAHKFHLGKIGFELAGKPLSPDTCKPVSQRLNLWEGILSSEYTLNGGTVQTETFVHPFEDTLYLRVKPALLSGENLQIALTFPYGSHKKTGADFNVPRRHTTRLEGGTGEALVLEREMDSTRYRVTVALAGALFSGEPDSQAAHTLRFSARTQTLELAVHFEPLCIPAADIDRKAAEARRPPSFAEARSACLRFWQNYWTSGGAIDFSESSDRRAGELERRIVLSRYLTAIQSRGVLPPAETGLTCNSWYGKFHLEMLYWHSAFWPLWGQAENLKKLLVWYKKMLPLARRIAASQGYRGARWPKMCDPTGYNTPSSIAALLIWQQPHPLMLTELCYQSAPDPDFLRDYRDVVVETAGFMASFVHWTGPEDGSGACVLGPPYIPAQERHDPKTVLNAPYELEYFRWGFRQADRWLKRLGEAPRFETLAENLAPPPQKDGLYLAHENCPDTFTRLPFYTDHPSMLAIYGILNSEKTDPARMSATLDQVIKTWDMSSFYGWDFPMMAMTACRLERYDDAVDLLLMESPKNTWLPNGHNRQAGDKALPLYLPGNGGLLIAAAMLAAGYGAKPGPLFPKGFSVQTEGLHAYI
ncbi:MAG: hypothetical protein LBS57_13740 [Treponema sp.]|jgi:hypothetical protein|nr:hypothetical protein [Treponema sp.]